MSLRTTALLPSRPWWKSKTLLGFVTIFVLLGAWRWSVHPLTWLPPHAMSPYQAITICVFTAIATICLTLAGVKHLEKIVSLKSEALSTATTLAQNLSERREEHIVSEHTERIIDEGAPGAPARRPWSPITDDDN